MSRYFVVYAFLFFLINSLSAQFVAVSIVNGTDLAGRVWSFKSELGQDKDSWRILQDEGYCPDGTRINLLLSEKSVPDSFTKNVHQNIRVNENSYSVADIAILTVDSYTSIRNMIIKRNIQLWKQPDLSMICMHDMITFQKAGNVPVNFIKNI